MGLQFILGRANSNKDAYMLNSMLELIKQDPDSEVFYLVPDHIKFENEMKVLKSIKESTRSTYAGTIRLQVFSFTRLAWYFLQGKEVLNKTELTETGLSMLIKKIVDEQEEDLTLFRGESQLEGFVEKLTALFMEFRNGRISPDDMESIFQETGSKEGTEDYRLKLHDLHLLFTAFMAKLKDEYIEQEDLIQALIAEIEKRELSNTTVFIDYFESFSAQEQELIIEFIKHVKEVKVSLTLDQSYAVEPPELTDLFYQPGVTYFKLYQTAREYNLQVHFDKFIQEADPEVSGSIRQLGDYWVKSQELTPAESPEELQDDAIEVWEATTRQAELLHVSNKIRQLVSENHCRYKDILVVTRQVEDYRLMLKPFFEQNNIPYFIDTDEAMSKHPLVDLIQSLLLIVKRYFRYEDIMRFVRTELIVPAASTESSSEEAAGEGELSRIGRYSKELNDWREKVDIFENVMLAYGYEGAYWLRDEEWIYARFNFEDEEDKTDYEQQIQDTANDVKEAVREVVLPFYDEILTAETNHQAASLIYQFLIDNGIKDQLLFWRDQALEEERLEDARKHEQIWKTFVQLLDEFVELLGEEVWDLDAFLSIIETGFENTSYSIVPPSIDQIIVSSFDKSHVGKKKIVFYMGMNDTCLPMSREQDSILTDEDREQMGEFLTNEQFLSPLTQEKMAGEPFAAYQAFGFGSQKLIFSYAQKNDGSSDHKLSPYLRRVAEHFSITPKPIQFSMDVEQENHKHPEHDLSFIGSRRQTVGQLIAVLRNSMDSRLVPKDFWLGLYKYVRDRSNSFENKLFRSLTYKNLPVNLEKDLAEELYGRDLHLSVSQLESYYLDPYSHFLRYGLRLEERMTQKLTPAETGNFFHESLDLILKQVLKENKNIDEVTDAELDRISADIFDQILAKNAFKILSSTRQMEFIRSQLIKTVRQRVEALRTQVRYSKMKPKRTEVLFGQIGSKKGIPGLSFPLNNGGTLYLRGKIDRVDEVVLDNEHYLGIVDYKSSDRKFKFNEIYVGLMLQMLTYFDTALTFSNELFQRPAKPGAALYSGIKNPRLAHKKVAGKDVEQELLGEFQYQGLILNDEELLDALDLTFEDGKLSRSKIYQYYQKKDGSFSTQSDALITLDELKLLFEHNRRLIQKAGNEILLGNLKLEPFYEKKTFTPSVGGEYRPVSQFDALLDENNYRDLPKMKKKDLIDRLKPKEEENEE